MFHFITHLKFPSLSLALDDAAAVFVVDTTSDSLLVPDERIANVKEMFEKTYGVFGFVQYRVVQFRDEQLVRYEITVAVAEQNAHNRNVKNT